MNQIYETYKGLAVNRLVLSERLEKLGFDEETTEALETYILWNMRPSLGILERDFDYAKQLLATKGIS